MLRRSLLLVPIALLGALQGAPGARAQSTISVNPPIIELRGSPGETLQFTSNVDNPSEAPITLLLSAGDFFFEPKGAMHFVEPGDPPHDAASLKAWVTPGTERITLAPGERRSVTSEVTLPGDAHARGYTGVLFFTVAPAAAAGEILTAVGRAGQIVLVEVGETRKTARLTGFTVAPSGRGVLVTYTLRNTGNCYFAPTGTITLQSAFGGPPVTLSAQDASGEARIRAFPDVPRTFSRQWDPPVAIGIYTVTLQLLDGEGQPFPRLSRPVGVVPWRALDLSLRALRWLW